MEVPRTNAKPCGLVLMFDDHSGHDIVTKPLTPRLKPEVYLVIIKEQVFVQPDAPCQRLPTEQDQCSLNVIDFERPRICDGHPRFPPRLGTPEIVPISAQSPFLTSEEAPVPAADQPSITSH